MISARYTMPPEDNFMFGDVIYTAKEIRLERFQRSNPSPYMEVHFDEPVDLAAGGPASETVNIKITVSSGEIYVVALTTVFQQFQTPSTVHHVLLQRPVPAPFVSVKKDRFDASIPNQNP